MQSNILFDASMMRGLFQKLWCGMVVIYKDSVEHLILFRCFIDHKDVLDGMGQPHPTISPTYFILG